MKRGLNAFANSIDSGQPWYFVQADLGENFLVLVSIFAFSRPGVPHQSFEPFDKLDFFIAMICLTEKL